MKITINALQYKPNSSGIGMLLRGLFGTLAQRTAIPHTVILPRDGESFPAGRATTRYLIPYRNGQALRRVWFQTVTLGRRFGRDSVLLASDSKFPLLLPRSCRVVPVVTDLAVFRMPQVYQRSRVLLWRAQYARIRRCADRYVAISEFTKQEIVSCLGISPEQIDVVYCAADEAFARPIGEAERADVRARHALPEHYILFVGNFNPRKNLPRLIEAFDRMKAQTGAPHTLVIAGEKGWLADHDTTLAHIRHRDAVQFLGYVPDDDLPAVYAMAEVFAFPTLYEGFGIPVIEAQLAGVPVLASNNSCLPEVGGEGAYYTDPLDVEKLCEGMIKLTQNPALRADLVIKGSKNAARFSWTASADALERALERVNGMEYQKIYWTWREKATEDPDLGTELAAIEQDATAIEDRFYRSLEFGTGGLRGVIGAGTNRMNVYTVAKATQGLCAYLKATGQLAGVAIAYDSRIKADLFARTAACVFAANGLPVHLYPRLMPTPSLSFAVRKLGLSAGIVITASHNPAKYNGYKVYGADGCQITTEAAAAILAQIDAVDIFTGVTTMPYDAAVSQGLIHMIGDDVADAYLVAVSSQSLVGPAVNHDVSIVYTPLNGAGISCVPECLRRNGFNNIIIPEAQKNPDGNFPTCPYPNPEVREALEVGLACARENGSDLLLATDPDCDRVGVAVRDGDDYTLISGNQMGVLLLDFICRMRTEKGTMPVNPVAVKTIVTTTMADQVAKAYGVTLIDVLTGFKFIGEQIGLLEKNGEEDRYIFGFEESYGYLSGTFVRDKDAVNASLLICEMFIHYREVEGMTLVQALDALYSRYGAYSERLESYAFEGAAGFETMQRIMAALRENPPKDVNGLPVLSISDYKLSVTTAADGTTAPIDLPVSDVIQLRLEGGASFVVRPSGTEPKLKIYMFTRGEDRAKSETRVGELVRYCADWVGGF